VKNMRLRIRSSCRIDFEYRKRGFACALFSFDEDSPMLTDNGKEMCGAINLVLICPGSGFGTRRPVAALRLLMRSQKSHWLTHSSISTHKPIRAIWWHLVLL